MPVTRNPAVFSFSTSLAVFEELSLRCLAQAAGIFEPQRSVEKSTVRVTRCPIDSVQW